MLVTIKTIRNKVITYELSPTTTIEKLKEKLLTETVIDPKISEYTIDKLRVVNNGKVLQNNDTVECIKSFAIVMVTKTSSTPATATTVTPAVATTTPASESGNGILKTDNKDSQVAAKVVPKEVSKETKNKSTTDAADSKAKTGDKKATEVSEKEKDLITNLLLMGFEEKNIKIAIASSEGNQDTAVNILLTKTPSELEKLEKQIEERKAKLAASQQQATSEQTASVIAASAAAQRELNLTPQDIIRDKNLFTLVFEMYIEDHPEIKEAILQNPNAINEHMTPQGLVRIVTETLEKHPEINHMAAQMSLTQDDMNTVDEICAIMGHRFTKEQVIEVYVAGGKSKEFTMNELMNERQGQDRSERNERNEDNQVNF